MTEATVSASKERPGAVRLPAPEAARRRALQAVMLAGGLCAVVFLLARMDIYGKHFFERTPLYLVYNILRVILLFYFGCIMYSAGAGFLRLAGWRSVTAGLGVMERFFLLSVLGGSLVNLMVFVLGWSNLLYRWLVVLISSGILVYSYADVRSLLGDAVGRLRSRFSEQPPALRWVFTAQLLLACLFLGVILVTLSLAPFRSTDVINHYHKYFLSVTESHNIWPNDIWYHFYVSKGAGLHIMGVLLGDINSIPLVSFVAFVLSGCLVVSFAWRKMRSLFWAAAVFFLYTVFFLTLGYSDKLLFERHHIVTAAFIGCVVWMGMLLPEIKRGSRHRWVVLSGIVVTALMVWAPTSIALVLPYLLFGWLLFVLMFKGERSRMLGFVPLSAAVVTALILGINYVVTGLAEATPTRLFWKFGDLSRFSTWVSPYLMMHIMEGSGPGLGGVSVALIRDIASRGYLEGLLRLDRISFMGSPLFLGVSGCAAAAGCWCRWKSRSAGRSNGFVQGEGDSRHTASLYSFLLVLGFLVIAVIVSPVTGQYVSICRYYVFAVTLMVLLAVHLGTFVFECLPSRLSAAIAIAICLLIAMAVVPPLPVRVSYVRFALGRLSMRDFYERYAQVPASAWEIPDVVGPGERVWSVSEQRAGRLLGPGVKVENTISSLMCKNWHVVVFEDPEAAAAELKKEGLNYFLLDLEQISYGALCYSPLFAPENIGRFFSMAWQSGSIYLLSWRADADEPLPEEFVESWTSWLDSDGSFKPLYERTKSIYAANEGRLYPIYRDPSLPPVRGWQ